jgi:hypothetical protein
MNPVAPSADELLANPVVVRALQEAWADPNVADAARRHEEGGWIYYELGSGALTVLRAPGGGREVD